MSHSGIRDSDRRARLGWARLVTVAAAGFAVVALQAGVASAGMLTEAQATGPTEAAARQNFAKGVKQACSSRGGVKNYRIVETGQDGGQWVAIGTYECNR